MFDISVLSEIQIIKQTARQKIVLCCDDNGKKYLKRILSGDKREVYKNLMKIHHPCIVGIYYVGFDADTTIVEEYIEGISLSDYIHQGKTLSKKQLRSLVGQLLSAMEALHKQDIIHRDIKPDNILIDETNHIWLTDYDVARIYREETRRDTETMGTFGYAPIEQYGLLPTDYKTDIYAFGVTLKKLLDYLNIHGFLHKIAEKCKKLDPGERYKNVKQIKNAMLWHRTVPTAILAALIIVGVIGYIALGMLYKQDTDKAIPATDDDVKIIEKEPEEISNTDKSEEPVPDGNNDEELSDDQMESLDFDGVFYGFGEGLLEKEYSNLDMYPQVCIFSMPAPWEHLIFVEDITKSGKIKLGKNETVINADFDFKNGIMSVNLTDNHANTFRHTFKYDGSYSYEKSYTGSLAKSADIICYNFDMDEGTELLVGVAESAMGRVETRFYNNFNYCMAWCIKYDEETGFALCEGDMFSEGYSFQINNNIRKLNVAWEDLGDVNGYVLKDGKIVPVK